jgi:ferredoxin
VDAVRPPGALAEPEFLERCVKCGLCLRVCPTNVLQPALLSAGAEGLWTPVLDFRAGASGCQPACVACSLVCPTGALRPLTLDEKLGRGAFAAAGPLRLGTAFFDRGRCLPWAMDTPCIVCEENCPTSPKAIHVRTAYQPLRDGERRVQGRAGGAVALDGPPLPSGALGSGAHRLRGPDGVRHVIAANDAASVTLTGSPPMLAAGDAVTLEVVLRQPYVDPARCTGCGICEHVCPVAGRAGVRVTAEGESRDPTRALVLGRDRG